jgi:hypothetical protein
MNTNTQHNNINVFCRMYVNCNLNRTMLWNWKTEQMKNVVTNRQTYNVKCCVRIRIANIRTERLEMNELYRHIMQLTAHIQTDQLTREQSMHSVKWHTMNTCLRTHMWRERVYWITSHLSLNYNSPLEFFLSGGGHKGSCIASSWKLKDKRQGSSGCPNNTPWPP